jgi:group II intron reverse transcriptase/maturase
MNSMHATNKPFSIDKRLVYEAYKAVKSNRGAAGVDEQSIEQFDADLSGNLYKIWNRMSSGSYFPPPVRAVSIPKKSGGERILGVPTVADRVAQTVVKQVIEPILDPIFLADSYGYRPNKSALDAVGITRKRCWKYDWVLEFDIKGLFDNIDHELLLRAVRKHITCKWALLYIERWLRAPMVLEDGTTKERSCGTPQGGVVSPILANLFMHYAFDVWMTRTHSELPWCRYADDGLVHCRTEQEAEALKAELQARLAECHLEMHPTKTKVVYCKDGKRKGKYPNVKFDFLGYCFRPRRVRRLPGQLTVWRIQSSSQFLGDEGYAQGDSGLEFETSNTADLAGHCPATQSSPSGMDCVLWALCPLGAVSLAALPQSDARGVGDAQVQALQTTQSPSEPVSTTACDGMRESLRTLANRDDWRVCLMGAE